MADIVIDEWLWADLSGDNNPENQKEAFEFIRSIFHVCDRIVSVRGSRFAQKAFDLCKHPDIKCRVIAKYYMEYFLFDPAKSMNLQESSLKSIPERISQKVTHKEDYYLIQAYLTAGATVIVTTDSDILEAEINNDINCQPRNEFVASYIQQHRS